ncbi:MAG: tRNA (adenosine(37)-N6)-threonylcarbamoyltransferase complex dimerization subunit type 1 TsaB [Acidobacteria bacterium]|nr:MAG: tRNA (adenosine(37)-N6)-threonylcarbamoyltransferase complex dimerization subunit type 1 TsaB [Acidobacteriota bacterium]REK01437.1 MAG: tRNA (adenosine(37)-N6)-threonylcarbamoyltransferase complex dimerization subunit type 1 TsaB [Acidobacteriota bacterium]REK14393.1 MAG: tRNA (adenosine(37)-N6)-threonylcarbamoyltransferase complex dimerization subunit type 1 TsaB [Acidobacteriota bacterium]REK45108.1 MAG: tRNA (adenosine(37)-N6)-threonylcarbamoyltransferase complex dimerization subunit
MTCTLSIDTCIGSGSAVLYKDDVRLAAANSLRDAGRETNALVLIEQIVRLTNLGFKDIDEFVVTRGPGSFTGVRTGLSIVRGFLRSGTYGFRSCTTMQALTVAAGDGPVQCATLINAGRKELAVQEFERDQGEQTFVEKGPHKVIFDSDLVTGFARSEKLILVAEAGLSERLSVSPLEIIFAGSGIADLAYEFVGRAEGSKGLGYIDAIYTRDFIGGKS